MQMSQGKLIGRRRRSSQVQQASGHQTFLLDMFTHYYMIQAYVITNNLASLIQKVCDLRQCQFPVRVESSESNKGHYRGRYPWFYCQGLVATPRYYHRVQGHAQLRLQEQRGGGIRGAVIQFQSISHKIQKKCIQLFLYVLAALCKYLYYRYYDYCFRHCSMQTPASFSFLCVMGDERQKRWPGK